MRVPIQRTTVPQSSPLIRAHGSHIMLDFTEWWMPPEEGAEAVMELVRAALREEGVREVHHKAVVLGTRGESPPGFTAVVLIDESHVTAHCYADRGWLALDVFTCGGASTARVAAAIEAGVRRLSPRAVLQQRASAPRFVHRVD
ncbi:S-adenosylmethionine decarboxylase [Tribonema minus]|uniref:S-adenosylmethionine decarboxylase n=1 Tax=Tribonema minus TaxID=303371 RepID=A0A835Z5E8_9STRA|nr:S-adenosylmethionine decarboxylase [Tribonema minus]